VETIDGPHIAECFKIQSIGVLKLSNYVSYTLIRKKLNLPPMAEIPSNPQTLKP